MVGMQVWWVHGPSGVGKSVTSWRLFEDLGTSDVACGYVDVDQLGMCYPERDGDSQRHLLKGRVLAGISGSYAAVGCERLVVSGVADPALMGWYADRLAAYDLRFCRLSADDAVLTGRLEARGVGSDWVDDALEEARELDGARLLHPVVDTAGSPVAGVAAAVRTALEGGRAAIVTAGPDRVEPASAGDVASALCVTGPTAVGKSAVAWALFMRLLEQDTMAYLDLEQMGFTRGIAGTATHGLRAANAGIAWECFRAAGARRLVLNGFLGSDDERRELARALAATSLR
jgi:hypothetical protein